MILLRKPVFDLTMYRYLAIHARGDSNQWFLNLQTESWFPNIIFQHRFVFQTPGEWETILVHFRNV